MNGYAASTRSSIAARARRRRAGVGGEVPHRPCRVNKGVVFRTIPTSNGHKPIKAMMSAGGPAMPYPSGTVTQPRNVEASTCPAPLPSNSRRGGGSRCSVTTAEDATELANLRKEPDVLSVPRPPGPHRADAHVYTAPNPTFRCRYAAPSPWAVEHEGLRDTVSRVFYFLANIPPPFQQLPQQMSRARPRC